MSFIADLFGAGRAQDNQDKALGNYADAEKRARGDFSAYNTQARADYNPFYTAGTGALGRMTAMETPGFQYSPSDPSYAWRFDQGQQAVDRSAASKIGLFSGGTLKALTDYGQGLASTEFNNDFTRNATLAGYGLDAANGMNQAGALAASGSAKSSIDVANGRASVYGTKSNLDSGSNSIWGQIGNVAGQVIGAFL